MRKSRGFTLVAVLTLALGIAANTVVFSVVNAVLIRPLPYANPERLLTLNWVDQRGPISQGISASAFFLLQKQARSFQTIAAAYSSGGGANFRALGAARFVTALRVSSDFFRTLGVMPAAGRDFRPEEDRPGSDRAVILSQRLWRQEFDKDPSALGREVQVNGEAYTIVGIMPDDFRSYPDADLWLPLQLTPETAEAGNEYDVIARLRDGTTKEQAILELESSQEYSQAYPLRASGDHVKLEARQWQDFMVAGARRGLILLSFATLLVLLIACTNLTVLFTVRGAARGHEFAIRAAVGASRARLVRTAFLDSALIALLGAVIGVMMGKEVIPIVHSLLPVDFVLSNPIRIDQHVLLFALGIFVLSPLTFGLPTALRMSRLSLDELLRRSQRAASAGLQETRLGRALISGQTALTLMLLASALSFLSSFLELRAVPPGFDPRNVSVAQVSLAAPRYETTAETVRLLNKITEEMQKVPGVEHVATVTGLPFEKGLNLTITIHSSGKTVYGQYRIVSQGYLQAMGIQLLSGRLFSATDQARNAPVVIVNERLAQLCWPHQSPIPDFVDVGKELGAEFSDGPRQIIGVVADVHETGLDQPAPPTIFVPLEQAPDNISSLANRLFMTSILVRTTHQVNLAGHFRRVVESADPDLPVVSLRPITQVIADSLARPRFSVLLVGTSGAFALLLTTIGFSGLLSYICLLRTREIGVRIAVGAGRSAVMGLIVRQGTQLVGMGILLGVIGFVPLAKLLSALFYNLKVISSGALLMAALILAAVALLTSLAVARRTTMAEPREMLESD